MGRVFTNGLADQGSISSPKNEKMVLDANLLNIQQYQE